MQRELSLSTDLLSDVVYPGELLPLMREAGFTYVHWCQDWNSERMYTEDEITRIAGDLARYDLKAYDLHASHGENRFLLLSENREDRRIGLSLLENRMVLIRALGGDTVVLHLDPHLVIPPKHTELTGGELSHASIEGFENVIREVTEALHTLCLRHGIRIAFENLRDTQTFNILGLIPFVEMLDTRWFGYCLDTGHAKLTGFDALDTPLFLRRLLSIHLSDNFGMQDDHMLPLSASIDWQRVMRMITSSSYQGPLTLEVSFPKHRSRTRQAIQQYLAEAYAAGCALLRHGYGG